MAVPSAPLKIATMPSLRCSLRPNPRGSANYGVTVAAANKNDLGGGDYQDIMAGVDAALARFPLDPQRMALIGYSYGGEMAGFVEGKTDRFKAIVSGAPVIDQFSEYGTESDSWYDELVTYPREDHGPLAMGIFGRPSPEPWHGFDARQRMVEFIEKEFASVPAKP
jgi:hypothetical protein